MKNKEMHIEGVLFHRRFIGLLSCTSNWKQQEDLTFTTFFGVGCHTERCLTQQNEQNPSQLGPPVLGHARLMAHADTRENCQQQENGWQTQD